MEVYESVIRISRVVEKLLHLPAMGKSHLTPELKAPHWQTVEEPQGKVVKVVRKFNNLPVVVIVKIAPPAFVGEEETHPPRAQGKGRAEQGIVPQLLAGEIRCLFPISITPPVR